MSKISPENFKALVKEIVKQTMQEMKTMENVGDDEGEAHDPNDDPVDMSDVEPVSPASADRSNRIAADLEKIKDEPSYIAAKDKLDKRY